MIIMDIRFPRIIMSILIGMMLSSSGVVVQAVFHNPLADPYLIGISASATVGAVFAFLLDLPEAFYGIFAFFMCVLTTFFIFKIANRDGKINTITLLIIGIAVSAFLGAFTSFAMYSIGEDSYWILMWTMGYIGGATWVQVVFLIIPLVFSLLFFSYHRHDLDALMMGEEEAHNLGINAPLLKKKLLVAASLIVAFSVAFTGMIGFVGLIMPHAMRMIVGYSNWKLIPAATLAGGIFLLICDTLARTMLSPTEIPIGVVTAFLGAPVFLLLAVRSKKGGQF